MKDKNKKRRNQDKPLPFFYKLVIVVGPLYILFEMLGGTDINREGWGALLGAFGYFILAPLLIIGPIIGIIALGIWLTKRKK